ncbi:MAG: hypothetical protein KDE47_28695 [Caldilineaceae bacterium]|nr:hypothetical protein [Caldilineaceae bacterium]
MNEFHEELRRTLQALAQPADVQISLFPSGVAIGDELVLEFDEAFRGFRAACQASPQQDAALNELDEIIERHSGKHNEDLWCDPISLVTDSRWLEMREAAARALVEFGWLNEAPSKNGAIYVFAARTERNDQLSSASLQGERTLNWRDRWHRWCSSRSARRGG